MTGIKKENIRKMMMDARIGHTSYLMFFLVFLNFLLISYNFLLINNPIFQRSISELWLFVIIFLILYCPTAIIIGRWHRNTQVKIEQDILRSNEPLFAKMFRTLLDVKTGKASEKEIQEFRNMLQGIEKNSIDQFKI
jgi:uncharacterized protein YneF (UPF0154 family)